MGAPDCEPLCQFSDRLFYTTFPHPAPSPDVINKNYSQANDTPRIRDCGVPSSSESAPALTGNHYFCLDDSLIYNSFYKDWGPLNLAMVYKACIFIHELHVDEELIGHRLILYADSDPKSKSNAALLAALYSVIVLHSTPWDAFKPIAELEFMPFRDAGRAHPDFNLSIQDCLWGTWKAIQHGLCDLSTFSVEEYEFYEKVENGDWNWITPGFLAFASPMDPEYLKQRKNGTTTSSALLRKLPGPFINCLNFFEERNVKLVVRLNNILYDRETFLERNINHVELFFEDGSNPTDDIVRSFLDMSDEVISAGGVVAVHCKAGLGRTGTLIGAYMIWKYGFTANEAIAFMRIARPGSVVGPQQQYMYVKQTEWSRWAAADEIKRVQKAKQDEQQQQQHPNKKRKSMHTPATSTPPKRETSLDMNLGALPPVTPSRHAALAEATNSVAPGQPRKTPKGPTAKATIGDVSENEEDDEISALPMLDLRPVQSRLPRTTVQKKMPATEHKRTAARKAMENASLKRPFVDASKSSPNKVPRLAGDKTTKRPLPPPSPSPIRRTRPLSPLPTRLPQLATNKKSIGVSLLDASLEKRKGFKTPKVDGAWMSENAQTVVVPGNKSTRPAIRAVRKRRSSFSSADVVA